MSQVPGNQTRAWSSESGQHLGAGISGVSLPLQGDAPTEVNCLSWELRLLPAPRFLLGEEALGEVNVQQISSLQGKVAQAPAGRDSEKDGGTERASTR